MLAMGIDPGNAICGYGFVELNGNSLHNAGFGVIRTTPSMRRSERLKVIYDRLDELIHEKHPDVVGVEKLFFNRNVTTAMTVSEARGVILLAIEKNLIPLLEPTPLQVKQAVVGYGQATKEQVTYMTQRLLCLEKKPTPDDAADALAIAICSAHSSSVEKIWRG
ncbi:MAG TPA: crossover junction endodeoxyribonuclease RuvC [Negativicutes bacterium]|nr:crossover junction endodeoxyribonuclease RuvC [Negativicutes bacterium]